MRSNLDVLIAQHNQKPARGKRVSKRSLAEDLNISRYTIYALAENKLDMYPREVLESLCNFFDCDVGDLISMQPVEDAAPAAEPRKE